MLEIRNVPSSNNTAGVELVVKDASGTEHRVKTRSAVTVDLPGEGQSIEIRLYSSPVEITPADASADEKPVETPDEKPAPADASADEKPVETPDEKPVSA